MLWEQSRAISERGASYTLSLSLFTSLFCFSFCWYCESVRVCCCFYTRERYELESDMKMRNRKKRRRRKYCVNFVYSAISDTTQYCKNEKRVQLLLLLLRATETMRTTQIKRNGERTNESARSTSTAHTNIFYNKNEINNNNNNNNKKNVTKIITTRATRKKKQTINLCGARQLRWFCFPFFGFRFTRHRLYTS